MLYRIAQFLPTGIYHTDHTHLSATVVVVAALLHTRVHTCARTCSSTSFLARLLAQALSDINLSDPSSEVYTTHTPQQQ